MIAGLVLQARADRVDGWLVPALIQKSIARPVRVHSRRTRKRTIPPESDCR
jgi:hypothetical protein